MPLLEIDITTFPTHMYQGQIEKVTLVLKNTGFSGLFINVIIIYCQPFEM